MPASRPPGDREVKRRGRPPALGQQQAFSLRLPAGLHQELKHYVVDHPETSLNGIIVEAVERWWSDVPDHDRYSRMVAEARNQAKKAPARHG